MASRGSPGRWCRNLSAVSSWTKSCSRRPASPVGGRTRMTDRFERQERLFGKEGQAKLTAARVAVVGVGGLGTHVVQQLALLGVGELALIDSEELATTDRNRYVGARHDDPIPGTPKVVIGERTAMGIDPAIKVVKIPASLVSDAA